MSQKKNDMPEEDDVSVDPAAVNPSEEVEQDAAPRPTYEELEQQLSDTEIKVDKLLRQKAEFDNMQKRSERDLVNAHKYALEKIAGELLPVMDNLERSLEHKDKVSDELMSIYKGVELTSKLLQGVFDKFAIKVINPLGEAFDPTLHEAMSMQYEEGKAAGTVLTVLQKGYQLNDRLLRPALVVVAKAQEK